MLKVGGVLLLVSLAGCTAYYPQASPRIVEVSEGYVVDGKTRPRGLFGSGLSDIVHGNPAAEAHMNTYRSLSIAGFTLDMTGLVGAAIGGAVAATDSDPTAQAASYAGVAIGLSVLVAGLIVDMVAGPHRIDAINIYNDGVMGLTPVGRPAADSPRPGPISQPGAGGGGCVKDTDCKGERVCDRGECSLPKR